MGAGVGGGYGGEEPMRPESEGEMLDLLALLCFSVICLIVGEWVIRGVLR